MAFAGDPASFLGASGFQGRLLFVLGALEVLRCWEQKSPWLSEWLDRSDGMVKWKFLGEGNQKKPLEQRIETNKHI